MLTIRIVNMICFKPYLVNEKFVGKKNIEIKRFCGSRLFVTNNSLR